MEAPREDLIRAVDFEERASLEDDGNTMVGYPVVFDRWTTIDSWEGRFKERISPSALNRTLKNNRDKIQVLFNHGMDPAIGDKPLGKARTMKVDEKGLYVEVPLSDTSYNADLRALMSDGAIKGQSFRFSVVAEEWAKEDSVMPERTITELKLYEFGPVTFPAYEATTVGVRSREDFAEWRGLTDDKRARIEEIMRAESSTRIADPAEGHVDDPARSDPPTDPPQGTPEGLTRQARERALFLLQECA